MIGFRLGAVLGVVAAGCVIYAGMGLVPARADDDRGAGPASKTLTICAIPESMPRTGKNDVGAPVGLDVAVVEQLAKILGRPIEFHWCGARNARGIVCRRAAVTLSSGSLRIQDQPEMWPGVFPMQPPNSDWLFRATLDLPSHWQISRANGLASSPEL